MIVAGQADEVIRADSGLTDGAVPSEPCLGLHGLDASLNPEEVLEFAVLPDELAKFSEYLWPNPSPVLDVAIGEREVVPLRMPVGRKVPPLRLFGEDRTPGRDAEVGFKDAVLMDAHEEQKTRRWRIVDLMFLGKARREVGLVGIRVAIDGLTQVIAARPPHRQQLTILRFHTRHIGRTSIDPGGFVVGKEQGALDILGGGIVGRQPGAPCHIVAPAGRRPSGAYIINVSVGRQKAVVVHGIKFCTGLKLLQVVQAGDFSSLGLGPRKRRQQDCNEKRENRDDDQEFDQRKGRAMPSDQ
jgi:hypothetical protein